jgi:hypothetical protein
MALEIKGKAYYNRPELQEKEALNYATAFHCDLVAHADDVYLYGHRFYFKQEET